MASFIVPLLLLLSFHSSPSSATSAQCNNDDKKALLAVKSFWGNPSYLAPWVATTPCCSWPYLACDTAGRVTLLLIAGDSTINGTIPPSVGDLRFLTSLSLQSLPNLAGPIIPTLARLRRLTSLDLHKNSLSGPIPSFLASIPTLETINLSFNRLAGSLPPELSTLPKLNELMLDGNRISGPIPDSFGKLPPGISLYLSNNRLTGVVPRSLGSVHFNVLDLSWNRLAGDASFLLGPSNNSISWQISLSGNMLEFDLGKVVFSPKLVVVDVKQNKIYGSIPQQIAALDLLYLNVTYNRLCGKIPTGGNMGRFDRWSYVHNPCLCGTPLPPCK